MFDLPFNLPAGDPSTSSQILVGFAPTGEPIVSVVFGMSFDVMAGKCVGKRGFEIQKEWVHTPAEVRCRRTRPSLLVRDIDTYVWRNFTDLVVRGTARSERPVESLDVTLSVTGAKPFERRIVATGDRFLDKGQTGLVLSSPVPFTEMPMRYDKAYGGTDELAETMIEDPEYLQMLRQASGDDADEISEYSYPRNPAGKGYLIDEQGLVELPWPNLEFPEERLSHSSLEAIVRPRVEWGDRPYPACFDWFPHGWFPRCAYFADFPETKDGGYPKRELALGMFKEGEERMALFDRPKSSFANGAHPYLSRGRFKGDEVVRVTHMSKDGRPFEAALPALSPKVAFRFLGQSKTIVDASLDLVLLETDQNEATLLWRATMMHTTEHLPMDWIARSPYEVLWS